MEAGNKFPLLRRLPGAIGRITGRTPFFSQVSRIVLDCHRKETKSWDVEQEWIRK